MLAALFVFLAHFLAALLVRLLLAWNDGIHPGDSDMDWHHRNVDRGLGDRTAGEQRQRKQKWKGLHSLVVAFEDSLGNSQSDEKKLHIRSLALIALEGGSRV